MASTRIMLSPPAPPACSLEHDALRAYSDPVIFRSDRVLRTLIRREARMGITTTKNYFSSGLQTELKPHMRKEVATWMLEICEEEQSQPEVFCLAVNYLDRFLSVCNIRRSQLQLLGAVCLLVSWKVREHSSITAQKLIEFTDYNVSLDDLLEWEFLLLSKLDWDLSAVIAPDFVEHILQRLLKLDLAWNIDITRKNAETLIYLCYSHMGLASYPPSLIAVASIVTTLRPTLESYVLPVTRDTPSPSSTSSGSTHSSPNSVGSKSTEGLDRVIDVLQKVTLVEKDSVMSCMEKLEEIMRASLPPSPSVSDDEKSPVSSHSSLLLPRSLSASTPILTSRSLFPDLRIDSDIPATPTKLLEAARNCSK